MELTIKEIELVFLAASIASGCKPCLSYHGRKAKEAGASTEEILKVVTISLNVLLVAKSKMKTYAMNLLGQSARDEATEYNPSPDRISILVSIGVAYAANCTFSLNKYIVLGRSAGITNDVLYKVFKAVKFVKMKAASYVDDIANRLDKSKSDNSNFNKSDVCGCEKSESNPQIKSNNQEVNPGNNCC